MVRMAKRAAKQKEFLAVMADHLREEILPKDYTTVPARGGSPNFAAGKLGSVASAPRLSVLEAPTAASNKKRLTARLETAPFKRGLADGVLTLSPPAFLEFSG
jgi:hypothetical protein